MEFKEKLKKLRSDKGASQYDLAQALNISRSVVAKWETGLTLPNNDSLTRLSEYFNISKDELISDFEQEQAITNKNRKISKFQKVISFLIGALALSITTIVIIASIGLKRTGTGGNNDVPPTINNPLYTLVIDNDNIYTFNPTLIKPSNEYEQPTNGFLLEDVHLNRKDIIQIYKNGEKLTNVIIHWSGQGVSEPSGGYYLYEEGAYDITLVEKYYGTVLQSIELNMDKVDSIYQDVKIYFVDNDKQPILMKQITKQAETNFTSLLWCWYIQDCELEEGDRIYFFTRLKVTNELHQIIGFENDTMFEEIYDEELKVYYIEVKETHIYDYLLLRTSGALMDLYWEYTIN